MAEQRKDEFQEQELERYGVWVKAGPEEVVEADEEDYSFADLPSDSSADITAQSTAMDLEGDLDALEIPTADYSTEELGSLDDLDTKEELGTLDDLDTTGEFGDDELGSISEIEISDEIESLNEFDIEEELGSLDDVDTVGEIGETPETTDTETEEDIVSLDDFGAIEDTQETVVPTASDEEEEEILVSFDDLDAIEEVEETVAPPASEETEEEILVSFDDLDTIEEVEETVAPTALDETEEEDLVSLDDLDIEEPEDEQDPFAALDVESESLSSLEEEAGIESIMPGSDDEIDEISLEDIQVEGGENLDIPELEEEGHHFTPEEQEIEIVSSGPTNHLTPEEEELLDVEEETPAPQAARAMDEDEREAFQRIQEELDDIKHELSELRAALRSGGAVQVAEPTTEEAPESTVDEDDAAHHGPGFFEEDEDETIALTGDELDNILNTAEFTEETGETEELEEDFVTGEVQAPTVETEGEEEPLAEITEIALDDSEEAMIDELAEMNIEAELADIESLEDTSEEPILADELELDLDEIAEIGGDEDIILEEEETETELDLDETGPDIDLTELDEEVNFEEFAAAVEDDIASADGVSVEEDIEVEEIDLDEDLEVIEIPNESEPPETVETVETAEAGQGSIAELPSHIKNEIRSVLSYMDQLLEALPDDKIEEFAQSEHFEVYKRLFEELGLET